MRITLTFLAALLLGSNLGNPQQQNSNDSCSFNLDGESFQPTIKGPNDIVPLVYIVEQPDSPVEVLSVDLKGMWLSISSEQHTERDCVRYTIRNRSNRTVQKVGVMLRLATTGGAGGGTGTPNSSPLAPGRELTRKMLTNAEYFDSKFGAVVSTLRRHSFEATTSLSASG